MVRLVISRKLREGVLRSSARSIALTNPEEARLNPGTELLTLGRHERKDRAGTDNYACCRERASMRVFCEQAVHPEWLAKQQVYEDESFVVVHQLDGDERTTYLGTLLLQTKRHVRTVGDLTDAEARTLGHLLSRISRALIRTTGAEWTHTFSFTEAYRHIHFIVAARYPGLPKEYYRLNYVDWPGAPRGTRSDVEDLCARIRTQLSTRS